METFEKWAPHKATPEKVAEFERKLADESDGVSVLPGVTSLLEKIPTDKWGIYTGGTQYMAKKRLGQSKLPRPRTVICGDMVKKYILIRIYHSYKLLFHLAYKGKA